MEKLDCPNCGKPMTKAYENGSSTLWKCKDLECGYSVLTQEWSRNHGKKTSDGKSDKSSEAQHHESSDNSHQNKRTTKRRKSKRSKD
jgi:ribosomal protein L37AE/L43A